MARSGMIEEPLEKGWLAQVMKDVRQETEEWREVPGFEGEYIASSEGRVAKIVGQPVATGYIGVILPKPLVVSSILSYGSPKKGRDYYRLLLHHVIALTFLGPPPNDEQIQINHKDTVKSNNRPSNLEWSTQGENVIHSWNIRSTKKKLYKYSVEDYQRVRDLRAMNMTWREIAKLTGMSNSGARFAVDCTWRRMS